MRRYKIILIHPSKIHSGLSEALSKNNIDVKAIAQVDSSHEVEKLFANAAPNALQLQRWSVMNANLPPDAKLPDLLPAEIELTRSISAVEATIIQVFDRCNYRLSVANLRHKIRRQISFWDCIFKSTCPDALFFIDTPHTWPTLIAYELAKIKKINCIVMRYTQIPDHVIISCQYDNAVGPTKSEWNEGVDDSSEVKNGVSNLFANRVVANRLNNKNRVHQTVSFFSAIRPLISFRASPRKYIDFMPPEKAPFYATQWRIFTEQKLKRKCYKIYHNAAQVCDLESPFIFVPLHVQPEATTLPMAGDWHDQLHWIQTMAHNLPSEWKLYVKEHPAQFTTSSYYFSRGRDLDFYRELASIPNVVCVPLDMPSNVLIAKSKAVCTLTGTAGWEAAMANIPAIVFGNAWYERAPGVMRVDNGAEFRSGIDRIIAGDDVKFSPEQVQKYVNLMREKYCVRAVFHDQFAATATVSVAESNANLAQAIRRILDSESSDSVV